MSELRIWKYPLKNKYKNIVEMPEGAKILCLKVQYKIPTIWALVNPDNPLKQRLFCLVDTDASFMWENYIYIDTVLSGDQTYVLHCFELNLDPEKVIEDDGTK